MQVERSVSLRKWFDIRNSFGTPETPLIFWEARTYEDCCYLSEEVSQQLYEF